MSVVTLGLQLSLLFLSLCGIISNTVGLYYIKTTLNINNETMFLLVSMDLFLGVSCSMSSFLVSFFIPGEISCFIVHISLIPSYTIGLLITAEIASVRYT